MGFGTHQEGHRRSGNAAFDRLWSQLCPRSQCDRENARKGEGVLTGAAGACVIAINYGRATDRRIVRVTSILAADLGGYTAIFGDLGRV